MKRKLKLSRIQSDIEHIDGALQESIPSGLAINDPVDKNAKRQIIAETQDIGMDIDQSMKNQI